MLLFCMLWIFRNARVHFLFILRSVHSWRNLSTRFEVQVYTLPLVCTFSPFKDGKTLAYLRNQFMVSWTFQRKKFQTEGGREVLKSSANLREDYRFLWRLIKIKVLKILQGCHDRNRWKGEENGNKIMKNRYEVDLMHDWALLYVSLIKFVVSWGRLEVTKSFLRMFESN